MEPGEGDDDCCWDAFQAGLRRSGREGGLLHHLFTCRTEGLAGAFGPRSLPSYLSGVLIGHEIREIMASGASMSDLTIVGSSALTERYRRAFAQVCGVEASVLEGSSTIAHGLRRIWLEVRRQREWEKTLQTWKQALDLCPVVSILRGLEPPQALEIGLALIEAGIRIIEVPLNSPQALVSIKALTDHVAAQSSVIVGAGTVLTPQEVDQVAQAGGRLIVSPNLC